MKDDDESSRNDESEQSEPSEMSEPSEPSEMSERSERSERSEPSKQGDEMAMTQEELDRYFYFYLPGEGDDDVRIRTLLLVLTCLPRPDDFDKYVLVLDDEAKMREVTSDVMTKFSAPFVVRHHKDGSNEFIGGYEELLGYLQADAGRRSCWYMFRGCLNRADSMSCRVRKSMASTTGATGAPTVGESMAEEEPEESGSEEEE